MRAIKLLARLMLVSIAALAACKGSNHANICSGIGEAIEMRYADNLIIEEANDYTLVTVRNPWDTTKVLQRYVLVDTGAVVPDTLPEATLIRTPVTNALVYSTVHTSLIAELGAIDAIGGVCNADYVKGPKFRKLIDSGQLVDCGNSMSPNMEQIIKLNPQVIMLSPFENNDGYAKVGELSISIIECADYMESSPLGRAEWLRFYGLLFGCRDASERMFAETESRYNELRNQAATVETRPKVIIDQRYGQVWNVPCGQSIMGILIEDAGGINPFADYRQGGSVPLAPEKVLATAHDATVWFVRYNQTTEKRLSELAADASVNSQFEAFRQGNVYGCNTHYIDFYESSPFHPDLLLSDFINIIHPELKITDKPLRYYHKLEK